MTPQNRTCGCCGKVMTANTFLKHRTLPHYQCCGQTFLSRDLAVHRRTCDQTATRVQVQDQRQRRPNGTDEPLPSIACRLGCDSTISRDNVARHLRIAHFRCNVCRVVLLARARSTHQHDEFTQLRADSDTDDGGHPSSAGIPQTEPVTSSSRPDFSKHADAITSLLLEMEAARSTASSRTRWDSDLKLVKRLIPDPHQCPFARVGVFDDIITGVDDTDFDVWILDSEQMDTLVENDYVFRKPVLLRDPKPPYKQHETPKDFFQRLENHHGNGLIDVQDPGARLTKTSQVPVTRMTVTDVISRLRQGSSFDRRNSLPINLLNIRSMDPGAHKPEFLRHHRFDILPAVVARTAGDSAGKRRTEDDEPYTDLADTLNFDLYGQRGVVTAFHVDSPDGTWVRTLNGLKFWMFAERKDEALEAFKAEGAQWVPEAIRGGVVLEAGDVLVMPAGEVVPHAVLTIADSRTIGGMHSDSTRAIDVLKKLIWVVKNNHLTNEPVPAQLLSGWQHFEELMTVDMTPEDAKVFRDLVQELRRELSCQCGGDSCDGNSCGGCGRGCRCGEAMAQDYKCTVWCHGDGEKKDGDHKMKRLVKKPKK